MNIIFAVDKTSFSNPDHAGVNIKVASQIKQMEAAGHSVTLQQYEWADGQLTMHVEKDTDVLYFRRIVSSLKLIQTLKRCKQTSPKLKIIMEIPTYPFKGERGKLTLKQKINEIIGDILLARYVDRIALCAVDHSVTKVSGVKTLHFDNGVDFEALKVNVSADKENDIHMICVSGCMPAHGYDRMIEGLNNYYSYSSNNKKVFFHIVGTGECYQAYVDLAKKYNLDDKYVIFHGRKTGSELDEIYAKSNLAVAHLAAHRIGLSVMSSLKSREYAARGIPFVSSTTFDFSSMETDKYICYVPADESPIDINKIIEFYENIYSEENLSSKMRALFSTICDWKYTFKEVLGYISK